ncbi:MAG: hypothetical protein ACXWC3_21410, partial [Burkholderiales bacterium]
MSVRHGPVQIVFATGRQRLARLLPVVRFTGELAIEIPRKNTCPEYRLDCRQAYPQFAAAVL